MAKTTELNCVAEQILAVLEARHYPANYLAEKRAALAGLDKAEALFFAAWQLDETNRTILAERLGLKVSDLRATGRVLRAVL